MRTTGHIKHYLLAAMIFAAHTVAWGQTVTVTYTTPGSYSALIPPCTTSANAEAWGAGGAGGRANAGGACGGGGGGGAFASGVVTPGPLTIIVGAGGNGNGGGGHHGGATSVATGATTFVLAAGGDGVPGVPSGGATNTGGQGGQASSSIGSITYSGGKGGNASGNGGTHGSGGGGGGAGSNGGGGGGGNGSSGIVNGTGGTGGTGAALSGGNGGNGVGSGSNSGGNGYNYGGGGGGSKEAAFGGSARDGGNGAGGQLILSFSFSRPAITGNNSYCEGDNLVLSVVAPCASANYIWKKDGLQVGTGPTLTIIDINAGNAGSYTVEYSMSGYTYAVLPVVSGNGIVHNNTTGVFLLTSASHAVTVNPKPTITWVNLSGSQNQSVCQGTSITSTIYSLGGSATGIVLPITNLPNGLTVTPSLNTITISGTPTESGTYTIYTTGQNSSCNPASISGTITYNPLPVLDYISDQTLCPGNASTAVSMTGTNVDAASTTWAVVAGTGASIGLGAESGTGNIPSFTTINHGTTSISVTIRVTPHSLAGCTGTYQDFTITVNQKPQVGNITPTVTTYCVGSNLIFPIDSPAIVASPAAIDSGWMLGATIITEPYLLDVADNGKPLFFYATNSCGTSYSDSLTITVIVTEIISIAPAYGPTAGGTYTGNPLSPVDPAGTVKITGVGFSPFGAFAVSSVTFDGVSATIDYIHSSDDTVYCIPPPRANSGYVLVSVTAGCGTATLPNGYHYDAMNITDVTPDYGPVTGGTSITLRGTGFLAGGSGDPNLVTVKIGGVWATVNAATVTDNEITCTTGLSGHSLLGSIEIFNSVESSEFVDRFTYYPVTFVVNGSWSEPYNWETQTDDRILPYPGAVVHIKANCLQDRDLNGSAFPYNGVMDSITVYSNAAYTIGNGITLDANVFTLKDSTSFLNYGNMRALQQNMERVLVHGRNWYVSSPLSTAQPISTALGKGALGGTLSVDGVVDLSSANAPSDWRVEWYNEIDHQWERLPSPASVLATGLGYTVYSKNEDIAVRFSGTYNDGNNNGAAVTIQSPALTRTEYLEHPKRGFNLVGNPFPSYWRWTDDAASSANVYSTIWYRTVVAGAYEFWSYNAAGNVGVAPGWNDGTPTGAYSLSYIPPLQAFWVRIKDGASSGVITFANDRRSHADHASNVLKSAETTDAGERRLLRIALKGDKNTDETLIYTDSRAEYGFDNYDSDKMFAGVGVELFTFPADQNRELVINGLPVISDGSEVTLGFQTDEGGNLSLHVREMLNFGSLDVYLRDRWRGVEHRLDAENPYLFTSGSEYNTERFSVMFRSSATGNDLVANDENGFLRAYSDTEGNIIVWYGGPDDCMVTVYDMLGNRLAVQNVTPNTPTVVKGKFAKGVYVLRTGKYATKVAIQRY